MKNIHVLPTDKPSRLFLNQVNNKLLLEDISNPGLKNVLPSGSYQNIYITSDEEIKEGDWILDNILVNKNPIKVTKELLEDGFLKEDKKIILTTDQDLIKDGVQAIDDEFLEWFVKNPNCEEIEVILDEVSYVVEDNIYKIIIPKEKHKLIHEKIIEICGGEERFKEICGLKPKQETLEEAAERIYREYPNNPVDKPEWHYNKDVNCFKKRKAFINGAKYQSDKMYSEEEVILLIAEAICKFKLGKLHDEEQIIESLEQFKKK